MRTIAIDAMGGEHAPEAIVEAVLATKSEMPQTKLILFGDVARLQKLLPATALDEHLEIIATTEVIQDEDEPVKAIRHKKDASLVVAARYVKAGKADALLSLGNTGALLAASIFIIGRIKGVARPGLMPTLPAQGSTTGFNMIDVGANAQSKPEFLLEWAKMAACYVTEMRGIAKPSVGLLNNGAEFDKGDPTHQTAYQLLKDSELNFIGNIEGNDLLAGKAEVIVTDGFTGNAALKTMEGTAGVLLHQLKVALLNGNLTTKIGALLVKNALGSLQQTFDTARYGGAVLLGVNAPVVKTHGRSTKRPIYYTLKQLDKMLAKDVIGKFRAQFQQ